MTYFGFLAVFLGIPIIIFLLITWNDSRKGMMIVGFKNGRAVWFAIALHITVALIYTTPWDNYLVATGVLVLRSRSCHRSSDRICTDRGIYIFHSRDSAHWIVVVVSGKANFSWKAFFSFREASHPLDPRAFIVVGDFSELPGQRLAASHLSRNHSCLGAAPHRASVCFWSGYSLASYQVGYLIHYPHDHLSFPGRFPGHYIRNLDHRSAPIHRIIYWVTTHRGSRLLSADQYLDRIWNDVTSG